MHRLQKCFSSRNERALHAIRKRLGPKAYKNALQDLHTNNREGVVKQVFWAITIACMTDIKFVTNLES